MIFPIVAVHIKKATLRGTLTFQIILHRNEDCIGLRPYSKCHAPVLGYKGKRELEYEKHLKGNVHLPHLDFIL